MNGEGESAAKMPSTKKNSGHTVLSVIKNVLPNGTRLGNNEMSPTPEETLGGYGLPPVLPMDVFAVTAYLLDISSAFNHYNPSSNGTNRRNSLNLWLSCEDKKKAIKAAESWEENLRNNISDEFIDEHWKELISCHDNTIRLQNYIAEDKTPPWWKPAYMLMIAADEVCKEIGYPVDTGNLKMEPLTKVMVIHRDMNYKQKFKNKDPNGAGNVTNIESFPSSITTEGVVNRDVVCVQPKGIVSGLGCTSRVFSKNLSLLPPRGIVRSAWQTIPSGVASPSSGDLNILLIPYPFSVTQDNFTEGLPKSAVKRAKWGTFDIDQSENGWLKDAPEQIKNLVQTTYTQAPDKTIHGIILPELALDYNKFDEICGALSTQNKSLKFVVSGSSSTCNVINRNQHEKGNFVLTRHFYRAQQDTRDTAIETTSRAKHHRWFMSREQIESNGLRGVLNAKDGYWENLHVGSKEVKFHFLNDTSVFGVMICEDLARSDPCHELVRAIGPNLLFAILMDGPQLRSRWAAKSVETLVQDPGCSVLTLSSLGMVDLSNEKKNGGKPGRPIAYWKDDSDSAPDGVEIKCADGEIAVILTLTEENVTTATIDDRFKENCKKWRYGSVTKIKKG